MCGIVGYVGDGIVEKELIEKLKKLEYRGYDSSGILTVTKSKFEVTKCVGKIENLIETVSHYSNSCCGIGHTRWATHGKVSVNNAHPHISSTKLYGIVHNGIIENYSHLKQEHLGNYNFYSETDTEVIANLLEYNHKKSQITDEVDVMNNIIDTCKMLKGSYALCICCSQFNNTVFIAKNKSPLFVTTNEKESIIASDISCFDDKFNSFYELKDGEFAIINNNQCRFFNSNKKPVSKKPKILSKTSLISIKDNNKSYMLNEIYEIPKVLENIIHQYKNGKYFEKINKNFNKILFIGCGTAFHACLIGEKYINCFSDIETHSHIASEFNYEKKHIDKNTLCIFVSQSGETFDTLTAMKYAKSKHAITVALTNVEHSTLARQSKYVLPTFAGPEIAVASTKAYNAQLLILYLLANYFFTNNYDYAIKSTQKHIKKVDIKKLSQIIHLKDVITNSKNIFMLGKNFDYITSKEATLKIKEITYLSVEAHPTGELKHGYIALIDTKSVVIIFNTSDKMLPRSLLACSEIKARGGTTILISTSSSKKSSLTNVDHLVKLPKTTDLLSPIFSIIPLQLLAEKISRSLGINPDKPKNLAKSVTVE